MTNRHWLKREVPAWVKEKLISEEEGKALLARYRKGKPGPYKEAFFVMALVCLLGGLGFWERGCGMGSRRMSGFCWHSFLYWSRFSSWPPWCCWIGGSRMIRSQ